MGSESQVWGIVRITAGTLVGGAFGYYLKHKLETNYREKIKQEMLELETKRIHEKKDQQTNLTESTQLLSDS